MEAPEKIYVRSEAIFKALQQRRKESDIEYTNTNAFIDKACEWIRNNYHNYANNDLGKEYLTNDFKNYMKGK